MQLAAFSRQGRAWGLLPAAQPAAGSVASGASRLELEARSFPRPALRLEPPAYSLQPAACSPQRRALSLLRSLELAASSGQRRATPGGFHLQILERAASRLEPPPASLEPWQPSSRVALPLALTVPGLVFPCLAWPGFALPSLASHAP